MSQVTLTVAGRVHQVACRDGDEPNLERLAELLNRHADTALRASGGVSGERTLLFIALMIADELSEAQRNPPSGIPPVLLERLAERLEAVASTLEEELPTS